MHIMGFPDLTAEKVLNLIIAILIPTKVPDEGENQ